MGIGFMRKVDRCVGVPIAFLFDISYCLGRLFGRNRKETKPRKILFLELSEMGSTVLAYPAMKRAKELFPDSELFFLIFEHNEPSIDVLDIIPKDNVFTINNKSAAGFIFDTLATPFRLRSRNIDTVIDMELFARYTNILSYLSGARNRVGFYRYHMEGLYKGNFQTHKVSYNPHQHISFNYLSLAYALKAPKGQYPLLKMDVTNEKPAVPKVKLSDSVYKNMLAKLQAINQNIDKTKKIIIINPHAGLLPIRAWPLENYIELTKRLLANRNIYIVITGLADAKDYAKRICDAVQDKRCIDLTGQTTFRELVSLYVIANLLITNDSGPAHFISLTKTPAIVFFGPETPKLYGPLGENVTSISSNFSCSPCVSAFNHRKTTCKDNKCMQAIKVDNIYELAKQKLKQNDSS